MEKKQEYTVVLRDAGIGHEEFVALGNFRSCGRSSNRGYGWKEHHHH